MNGRVETTEWGLEYLLVYSVKCYGNQTQELLWRWVHKLRKMASASKRGNNTKGKKKTKFGSLVRWRMTKKTIWPGLAWRINEGRKYVEEINIVHLPLLLLLLLLLLASISHHRQLVVVHWRLSDNKYPLVSRTLLSILFNLNNAVNGMVLILSLISYYSSPFSKLLETRLSAPSTIGITVTLIFNSYFSFPARSKY